MFEIKLIIYIKMDLALNCCRAEKHIDPANELSLSVWVMTTKDNEGNKGEVTNITKMTIYCRVYKRVCKVCDSNICVFS